MGEFDFMAKGKRAESRARYYIRSQSPQRGWKLSHPSRGGDCLEEQEIIDYFPDIGLGRDKPDFLYCLKGDSYLKQFAKDTLEKITAEELTMQNTGNKKTGLKKGRVKSQHLTSQFFKDNP